MRQDIKNKIDEYLQHKIEKESLVDYFRNVYDQSLQTEEYRIQLDLIIAITSSIFLIATNSPSKICTRATALS